MTHEAKLEQLIERLRTKAESLHPHTPVEHAECERAELRCARAEALLASLRKQEYLHPVPLVGEPASCRHHAHVETDWKRDAIVTFSSRSMTNGSGRDVWTPRRVQLVFHGVMHLAVVEEFHDQHRRSYRRRGHLQRFAFYELRASPLAMQLQKLRESPPLTHWVFYLWRMRVEVVATDVEHVSCAKSLAVLEE